MKLMNWKSYLVSLIPWALFGVATCVAVLIGIQPPPPPLYVETEKPAGPPEGYAETFGWIEDADAIAANRESLQFATTPAGRAVFEANADVFLWRAVRKVNQRGAEWYPNVNQQNVGCCVGCGFKHGADITQATQILAGRRATWKPVSVEAIYGMSRNDIGGGRISGDGSIGAWAKAAIEKLGVAAMQAYPSVDLSTFSPARARQFGSRSGVPADVKEAALPQLFRGCALVTTWTDVKRAITQSYPIAVCSNVGFAMERNAKGIARASGVWNHCMAIIGYAKIDGREYAFILNSWGDNAHTGGVWPDDMPAAGFWVDSATIERMVRQGDSFALADVAGFPARRPDWFLAEPRRGDALAIRPQPFTEASLSW